METDIRSTIKNNSIPKELEFILLCLNAALHQIDEDRLNTLSKSNFNWKKFNDLLLNQKVLPIIYPVIHSKCRKDIEKSVFNTIHQFYIRNAAKNLYYTSVLHKILDFLNDNGIMVVPFKGPALAEELYGDINYRIFGDLDILVSKEDAFNAFSILISNGFIPELMLNPKQFEDYQNSMNHIILSTANRMVKIELHWELSARHFSKPFTKKQIESTMVQGEVYGKTINRFSKEDLLVYLCVHGSKHSWYNLESIFCVATLLNNEKNLNWDRVLFLTGDIYCYKKLLLGLLLAKLFFKIPLPDNVLTLINKDIKKLNKLADYIFKIIIHGESKNWWAIHKSKFTPYQIQTMDRFRDKIRYLVFVSFIPKSPDWNAINLPEKYSFFYYFIRPVRLFYNLLKFQK